MNVNRILDKESKYKNGEIQASFVYEQVDRLRNRHLYVHRQKSHNSKSKLLRISSNRIFPTTKPEKSSRREQCQANKMKHAEYYSKLEENKSSFMNKSLFTTMHTNPSSSPVAAESNYDEIQPSRTSPFLTKKSRINLPYVSHKTKCMSETK
mmetsp:Transcript_16535/g.19117  ORF Transcript_16535/g.19117 Transcript_16535/m.19117 type:complete len:152 (+) Transcript_16535:978-1433(+)